MPFMRRCRGDFGEAWIVSPDGGYRSGFSSGGAVQRLRTRRGDGWPSSLSRSRELGAAQTTAE